ncbi:hypothetical protein [Novosphingobium taihuense]|uniref:Uncharacterized protein n=1 Tax=Novosphingobium taihuense TaxID=260085 RepID=A0A7W7AB22_9SPHN|nr:hypothetical protein [Novosphingobium taihuense]MBB4613631.1 hypothetical protein [Novosphingobium taihuense]TWH81126.1 hypothetical protein IQ25_03513 [Novosphingobium taihuense]
MKNGWKHSKLALIAGAALVVTAAGAMAQGMAEMPAPPAPPSPPAPPAPPEPGMAHQIVIVEKHGGEDGQEYVRTVTRDGKTFVFKSDQPMSDADVEAKIARAEAGIRPVPPISPVYPGAGNGERRIQRVIVIDGDNEGVTDIVSEDGPHCEGKNAFANVDTSEEKDGKVTRVRIRTCGSEADIEKHAMAEALDGIRRARDEIARDKSLSDSIRKQVLDELDAEMAKLKAKG